jgi:hypothetical protein
VVRICCIGSDGDVAADGIVMAATHKHTVDAKKSCGPPSFCFLGASIANFWREG